MNLIADSTFEFHSYEKRKLGLPSNKRFNERNQYVTGTCTLYGKVISLSTSANDFDEKYTWDFNNSKAGFISKHPMDKLDKVVETAMRFHESGIFCIEHLHILRIE